MSAFYRTQLTIKVDESMETDLRNAQTYLCSASLAEAVRTLLEWALDDLERTIDGQARSAVEADNDNEPDLPFYGAEQIPRE